jgi:two-component system response regulator ChvI
MTCAVCPNCGLDLERFEDTQRGDLTIRMHEILWRGRRVSLTMSQRLMVSAIARADGKTVRRNALAGIIETEDSLDPFNVVAVLISRIRRAFRDVDPEFDALKTVWGEGIRWAA